MHLSPAPPRPRGEAQDSTQVKRFKKRIATVREEFTVTQHSNIAQAVSLTSTVMEYILLTLYTCFSNMHHVIYDSVILVSRSVSPICLNTSVTTMHSNWYEEYLYVYLYVYLYTYMYSYYITAVVEYLIFPPFSHTFVVYITAVFGVPYI